MRIARIKVHRECEAEAVAYPVLLGDEWKGAGDACAGLIRRHGAAIEVRHERGRGQATRTIHGRDHGGG